MDKVGLYSGTFDPVTNGHLDVIERGYELFDRLYITVAQNINKKTWIKTNIKNNYTFRPRCSLYKYKI